MTFLKKIDQPGLKIIFVKNDALKKFRKWPKVFCLKESMENNGLRKQQHNYSSLYFSTTILYALTNSRR